MPVPSAAVAARLPWRIDLPLVSPCLEPPGGDGWLHELKHDGHRLIAIFDGHGGLRLISRNGFVARLLKWPSTAFGATPFSMAKSPSRKRSRGEPAGPMTLGNAAAAHVRLLIWCDECQHRAEIDPVELARTLGLDFPVPDLQKRLRCSACDARVVSFVVSGTTR
jgi:hypothetical protein